MAWTWEDLTGPRIIEHDSEGDVFTIEFGSPAGRIAIMADIELMEVPDGRRCIVLRGAHIHSERGAGSIGVGNLRALAAQLLERIDYDEAVVEGGARTTGANPGHKPRPFRFTRKREDHAGG